jgi:hypothetical protein
VVAFHMESKTIWEFSVYDIFRVIVGPGLTEFPSLSQLPHSNY